jgi:hypothetical protein
MSRERYPQLSERMRRKNKVVWEIQLILIVLHGEEEEGSSDGAGYRGEESINKSINGIILQW